MNDPPSFTQKNCIENSDELNVFFDSVSVLSFQWNQSSYPDNTEHSCESSNYTFHNDYYDRNSHEANMYLVNDQPNNFEELARFHNISSLLTSYETCENEVESIHSCKSNEELNFGLDFDNLDSSPASHNLNSNLTLNPSEGSQEIDFVQNVSLQPIPQREHQTQMSLELLEELDQNQQTTSSEMAMVEAYIYIASLLGKVFTFPGIEHLEINLYPSPSIDDFLIAVENQFNNANREKIQRFTNHFGINSHVTFIQLKYYSSQPGNALLRGKKFMNLFEECDANSENLDAQMNSIRDVFDLFHNLRINRNGQCFTTLPRPTMVDMLRNYFVCYSHHLRFNVQSEANSPVEHLCVGCLRLFKMRINVPKKLGDDPPKKKKRADTPLNNFRRHVMKSCRGI